MSKFRHFTVFAVLLSFGLLIAGCGGGGEQQQTTTEDTTSESAGTGSLMAKVNFDGEAPEPETFDASGNDECGVDEIKSRKVVVNDNGTLKNVVVAVKSGPSGLDLSSSDVELTQKGCMYQPHVVTAKAGQTITIGDQDQGLHNVRGSNEDGKQLFNLQTFKNNSKDVTIDNAGRVGLECDVHPWMQGWIYVTDHGAASVTDKMGEASLENLPAGDYTLEIWHEEYGTKTESVTIEKDKESSVSVTFSA